MYQPKVKNTQKYEDSQGSHIVTPAKLLLLEPNTKEWFQNEDVEKDFVEFEHTNEGSPDVSMLKPILISETEEIEEGDKVYYDGRITTVMDVLEFYGHVYAEMIELENGDRLTEEDVSKVLSLPEHFSDKHLQAIVDGKMREGGVLVKCTEKDEFSLNTNLHYDNYVWLSKNEAHITLFPAKQSLEKAFCREFNLDSHDKDLNLYDINPWKAAQWAAEWTKKNNY